jgi:ABC-2 type transport system ATP-binding protein
MLKIENLKVRLGNKMIIEDLSVELASSCIHGLVGLNGSGKSTLLNTLYSFIKPLGGSITLDGKVIERSKISFLETNNFFYSGITAREYLQLFKNNNKSFDKNIGEGLLGLPLDSLIEQYSVGMKKKLALLGVLKQDKPVLILDEPFNGLDIEATKIIEYLLKKLKEKGKTILITSHIIETLTNCCSFIHFLSGKKIVRTYAQDHFHYLMGDLFNDLEINVNKVLDENF